MQSRAFYHGKLGELVLESKIAAGETAVRRLAARLIPRFAANFPEKLDVAARSLMDLSAWDGANLPSSRLPIAENARLDALRGLGEVCISAAANAADSRTASSIILHLLRSVVRMPRISRVLAFKMAVGSHTERL